MGKWLRGWFVWRFSLGRLVVAVLVLGVFVGLNARKIGPLAFPDDDGLPSYHYGWPLPFYADWWEVLDEAVKDMEDLVKQSEKFDAHCAAARKYELPLTHQTYRLSRWDRLHPPNARGISIVYGIVDALLALGAVFLILFVRVPCSPAPAQAKPSNPAANPS